MKRSSNICNFCHTWIFPSDRAKGHNLHKKCRSRIEVLRQQGKKDHISQRISVSTSKFQTNLTAREKTLRTLKASDNALGRLRQKYETEYIMYLDEERKKLGLPPSRKRYRKNDR